jgi:hypothetical protein
MSYFTERGDGPPERIGKGIGTLIVAGVYIAVISLMISPMLR